MAAVSSYNDSKPPDSESSYSDTGQDVPIREKQRIVNSEFPSCQRQTINEQLNTMPMEEFEVLLEGITDKSKVNPKSAEIISQLEHQMKVQPEEEEIPTLTNSKYSSSLQSLLQNKERGGKTSNIRPADQLLYQQQSSNTFSCTTSSCPVSSICQHDDDVNIDTDNLPSQYYFNAAQDVYQSPSNPNRVMNLLTLNNKESQLSFISVKPSSTVFEPHEGEGDIRRRPIKSNNIQLINDSYGSGVADEVNTRGQAVDNLYDLTEASSNDSPYAKSPPIELIKMCTSGSSPNSNTSLTTSTSTLSPLSQTQTSNYQHSQVLSSPSQNPSPPSSTVSRYSTGSTDPNAKKSGKKGNRTKALREINITPESIDGWKGNQTVEDLVQFVEGAEAPSGKRGNKKKEREIRGKVNEPLVKSMSLDDDNLSVAAEKKTVDRNDRSSSLKDATGMQRSERGRGAPVELDKKEKGGSGVKKSFPNQGNRRESDPEDNRSHQKNPETKFTVVIRKRRNKTACSTSEPGSGAGRDVDKRHQELRRNHGERRKSVGSVPGSDHSEVSDDDESVRSLPAGNTQRENVPMSYASSSGGTPQTSYADIARLTKDEEKRDFSQAMEDYPSLHGSENSEGSSDDGSSIRSLPLEENTNKLCLSAGETSHTSYADIARLASHEEKFRDDKRDRPEDFPELLTTNVGATTAVQDSNVVEPMSFSPKSDLIGSASIETAFPKLTSSASKNSLTQGLSSNQKTIPSGVVSSTGSLVTPHKTNCTVPASNPVVVTAPAPTNINNNNPKPQLPNSKITSGATSQTSSSIGTPIVPFTKNPAPSSSTGSRVNVVAKKSTPIFTPACVLNSPPMVSNHSASIETTTTPAPSGVNSGKKKNTNVEFTNVVSLNGHLSDSEKDRVVVKRSDNIGAKSAFSVTIPQPYVVDQCTEAVVFCGENFKEPPQLPSKDLQFEFGFDVNEALVGLNKDVQQQHPPQMVPDTGALPDFQSNIMDSRGGGETTPEQQPLPQMPIDYKVTQEVLVPTVILEYPVNFAQYYLPPDSILYINANFSELCNYMERRTQEFQRLASEDPSRCRRVT